MALTLETDKPRSGEVNYAVVVPLGVLLFALGAVGFFLIYSSMTTNKGLAVYDQPVLQWMIAHRSGALTPLMQAVTTAFSPLGVAIGAGVLVVFWKVWKKEWWRPILLILALGATHLTTIFLKSFIHRGRPPAGSMLPPLESDFSFPSGHTVGVAAAMFIITYLVCSRTRKPWHVSLWVLLSLMAVGLIAFSRLYLGVHWLTDVSASVALALIMLAITVFIDSIVTRIKR